MKCKQIVIPEFGSAEVLAFQEVDIPQPKAGEVLVKVAYAGINPIDVKTRAGLGWAAAENKDNLPWVPGYDISGSIAGLGEGAQAFEVGQEVVGFIGFPLRAGGYSQYVCVPETELTALPNTVTLEAAAALPLAGQTAAQAINKAQVQEGERVLILAGAGGVGHIAVQLAVATKAEVYTTCSERNLDYLATLGAHAINYEFAPASERLSDVDVLIDLVGGDVALDALKCLKDNARVITIPTITAELVCEKAKLLSFEASGMLVSPDTKQMETLLYMVGVGLLKTEIQHVFPYSQVVEAHQQVETSRTRGKVLLDMQC
ncbi:NADP-dependent oxidoreductase [Vibrio mediterranei]|uniref:NADP-dependent oxidoreductase n=1 Tax=Vibrio mediterranei TaxID=689 RepID=UPI000784843A|nr:NADP-dependent oxidoreductase [Vibrio mediterranei]MCG9658539.1 NADP-dependent oxidoreductase [Vibrio mediterranei]MCG9665635.1 NADP-dependent oxidoreductase [Vibrio mediterranei]PTC02272.1 NADP-dependent oxidoreductase [Vibrio mediterranei]SBO09991.1 Quinone oxidoreductase 1 [Vibrio mediterranei]